MNQDEETESVFHIPKGLALKLMDYHGGQWSALYSISSRAFAGELVDEESIHEAITELEGFQGKEKEGALKLVMYLTAILEGDEESIYDEEDDYLEVDPDFDDDYEDEDEEEEDD